MVTRDGEKYSPHDPWHAKVAFGVFLCVLVGSLIRCIQEFLTRIDAVARRSVLVCAERILSCSIPQRRCIIPSGSYRPIWILDHGIK
jgi:hypothetical protein